jgi:hypothetical protein
MLFLDSFSSVLPNPDETPALDVARCRQMRKFAVLYTTAIAVFSGDTDPRQLCRFDLTTEDPSSGLFVRCAWVSSSQVGVVTTLGKILIFQQASKSIVPDKVISTSDASEYMCICSHQSCLVAGDSNGHVLFFSPDFQVVLRQKVSDAPIKALDMGVKLAVVLAADTQGFLMTLPRRAANPTETLHTRLTPMNPVAIAVSDHNDLGAFWMPTGRLMITNFKDMTNRVDNIPGVLAMSFSPDASWLAIACVDGVRIWSVKFRKMLLFPRQGMLGCRSVISLGRTVTALTNSGIYTWPVLVPSPSRIPFLYSTYRILGYRPAKPAIVPIVHDLPSWAPIVSVAGDDGDRFIAFASATHIGLISRRTERVIEPKHDPLSIRAIDWHRDLLAVLTNGDTETLHFYKVTQTDLQLAATVPLPARYGVLVSDNEGAIVVSYRGHLIVVDVNFEVRQIDTDRTFLTVKVSGSLRQIFAITEQLELISISIADDDFGQSRLIRSEVDDFYISATQSVIFTVSGYRIFIAALGSETRPRVFRRVSPLTVGIDPGLSGLIQIRSGQFILAPYSEFAARVHLADNPRLAAHLLADKSVERIAHVLARAIEDGEFRPALDVVRLVPDIAVDEVLAFTLKELKKEERRVVHAEIGSASEHFCRVGKARRSPTGEFVGDGPEGPDALLALLEPLGEDEGPIVACFAALFFLSKFNGMDRQANLALKFLVPMSRPPEVLGTERLSCAGVEISEQTYRLLKRRFDEITGFALVDRLTSFRVTEFVQFARLAGVSLPQFLSEHSDVANKMPADELVERIRLLVQSEVFPDTLRQALENAHWETWTGALKSVSDAAE